MVDALARARHEPDVRRRPEPHGRDGPATTRGGWTCSRTGRHRRYATFFDIDWQPHRTATSPARCWFPCSAIPTATVLERGELVLRFRAPSRRRSPCVTTSTGCRSIRANPRRSSSSRVAAVADRCSRRRSDARRTRWSMRCACLPPRDANSARRSSGRAASAAACKRELARLAATHAAACAIRSTVVVRRFNGTPGAPRAFEPLDALLEAQAFRLAYWRVAADEINYRRFFDVNDLAALRMEDAQRVRRDAPLPPRAGGRRQDRRPAHRPSRRAARSGARTSRACRPRYRELVAHGRGASRRVARSMSRSRRSARRTSAARRLGRARRHRLPRSRTRSMACSSIPRRAGASIACGARSSATRHATSSSGVRGQARHHARVARGRISTGSPAHALKLARADRRTRDFTFSALREALAETVAWFPVYRTYVTDAGASAQDRRYIEWAVSRARRATPLRRSRDLRFRPRAAARGAARRRAAIDGRSAISSSRCASSSTPRRSRRRVSRTRASTRTRGSSLPTTWAAIPASSA